MREPPEGKIVCDGCLREWPCHWDEWLQGGDHCHACQANKLRWEPYDLQG